ncbi:MAG: class I adenylate-forming enzyme family protein, partial [Candidatus Binatia bacterium]
MHETTIVDGKVRGVTMRLYEGLPPSLPAMLDGVVRDFGSHEAVVFGEVRWTYDELARRVRATAAELSARYGIARGDRVAILTGNSSDFPVAFFATIVLGGIAVPLNNRWTPPELRYALDDSGAKAVVIHPEYYPELGKVRGELSKLEHVFLTGTKAEKGTIAFDGGLPGTGDPPRVELGPEDAAGIFYTSGTTGFPKGALTTHRNFLTNCENARRVLNLRPAKARNLVAAPLFHATACHSQLIATIYAAGTCVILREFKADVVLDVVPKEKITILVGVPTMHWLLLVNPRFPQTDMSSVESVVYGGAPCPPDLV